MTVEIAVRLEILTMVTREYCEIRCSHSCDCGDNYEGRGSHDGDCGDCCEIRDSDDGDWRFL